jgi:CheY-like chemotaxis protein
MQKKLSCVLLIDDDEPTNFLNKMILEQSGRVEEVKVVNSGRHALEYLTNIKNAGPGQQKFPNPDLIFLDINMPAMDGWEFLEQYKTLPPDQKGNVVMVMLTTSLNPEDESKANVDGSIAGFRSKPLTRKMLDEILQEYFGSQ